MSVVRLKKQVMELEKQNQQLTENSVLDAALGHGLTLLNPTLISPPITRSIDG